MTTSLPGEQPKRTKTPQEFLGANSSLVNLDELVKPTEKKKGNDFCHKISPRFFPERKIST